MDPNGIHRFAVDLNAYLKDRFSYRSDSARVSFKSVYAHTAKCDL